MANEPMEAPMSEWPLKIRKRDFELALLEKLEARNGGNQHVKVGDVLTVAEAGLRYFGATGPLIPRPGPDFRSPLPPRKRLSVASWDSIARRWSVTLPLRAISTRSRRLLSRSMDIDFKFTMISSG